MYQRIHKSFSPQTTTRDRVTPHSIGVDTQPLSYRPSTPTGQANDALSQNHLEAFRLPQGHASDTHGSAPIQPPIASQNGVGFVQRAFQARHPQRYPTSSIQAKLTIGQPNDPYEQEADRVATQVVEQIQTPAIVQSMQKQAVQRQMILQRKSAIATGEASADFTSAIHRSRGRGQPLAQNLQQSMGEAMGADFSGVRVHTDAQSDQLNASIQAKAFTTGQDVFFRQGQYNPGSRGGQELIAHELTHVVQQSGGNTVNRKLQAVPAISNAPHQIQPSFAKLFAKAKHTKLDDVRVTAQIDSTYGPNCGTEMLFEIDIDVPIKQKAGTEDYSDFQTSKDRGPFSIYGLTLDYWEDIAVGYSFIASEEEDATTIQDNKTAKKGSFHKPWNDIYAFRPMAPTFQHYGNLSWGAAVTQAAAETLAAGQHTVTVRDLPSLAASDRKYMMRTLRFRVVLKDALGNSRDINATQILKMEDGVIVQNNYEDTEGNRIGVVGKENSAIRLETYNSIRSQLPTASMDHIGKFYKAIMDDTATPFDFFEADQAGAISYPNGVPDNLYYSSFMSEGFWYNLLRAQGAGTYGLPGLKTGETYVEYSTGDSGLLVARIKGKTIAKMYVTDGSTTDIKFKDEQTVRARQFTEIRPAVIELYKDRIVS